MPFDGNYSRNAELMWAGFSRYVGDTYAQNPYHSKSTEKWLEDLNARRLKSQELFLAFVELKNEITGRKVRAYRLNRQVYFSRDPSVLTIPYPRTLNDPIGGIYPDRLVGIYLHDFGYDQKFISRCLHDLRLTKPNSRIDYRPGEFEGDLKQYVRSVRYALKRAINVPSLPGGKANHLATWQLRLHRGADGDGWHRDDDAGGSPETWTRVLIHPVIRTGTLYALEGNTTVGAVTKNRIMCPVGAVSSHIAVRTDSVNADAWGVTHRVVPHRSGRAVLIKPDEPGEDWSSLSDDRSPWRTVKTVCAM